MRLLLFLFGTLFLFTGLLSLLKKYVSIPILPSEGISYNVMVALLGLIAMLIGAFGFDKVLKPAGLK